MYQFENFNISAERLWHNCGRLEALLVQEVYQRNEKCSIKDYEERSMQKKKRYLQFRESCTRKNQ